ncbi:MarR family winged helix-turn-helix transcriptional regulator [Mucilaginibacter paludis]|uniref:Regulatory protein MarR n=1 Tax=Mucilaginibacter paludis DSM 18603 TaxID=714943 RepID=H1YAL5_9SPHI|nr:MarR family winged helix-turn-helix transcriptional regulator [Mucilaginibacter paludis]EHQ29135.1 regulatory protein MarR [Mucilaginibacter paludis DSM 18603]
MERPQLIARNLRQIDYLYTKKLSKELSAIHVNNHFEVLLVLAKQVHPLTQNQLAQLLHLDKSRMANIVFQLEEHQLVSVEVNPADRRQHYVTLSPYALSAMPDIETKVQQINDMAEAGISQEKLDVFFEVVETIRQNLVKRSV